jgi:hypothetical protein
LESAAEGWSEFIADPSNALLGYCLAKSTSSFNQFN